MKRLTLAVLAVVVVLSVVLLALGLEVPPRPLGRITDLTNTLTSQQIASLEAKLASFERETTNQIAVLLIPTLAGDSLEDYSIRLAEKWKIGQAGKDNGVILLIVKNDRKLRIEVGYGLEGALPDALAKTIITQEIAPRFRQGDFYGGIAQGLSAIIQATKGEYKARPKQRSSASWVTRNLTLIFFLAFALMVIISAVTGMSRNAYRRKGYRGWSWSSGGGSWSGSSGGGGFSGGGGSFGGGGASGSW